ncbi:phytanoyl-CoA dioxygenase family protein [Oceanospirillum multiglobuliferum]|uniref:Phytanoyl-CoA dioxygenase n=1 Tax=Oceanospirillum multiglobuliferum TaxID=64969 RepID=A0A1V4T853_9GAMM|nr:phytanoyl-CoA dioxygenase family protein [Oceanospirillum multiglobuliferum]OPX56348.1 hypothetical protein BTE48_05110 [Oceanospirillum multiglobuliferum]
MPSCHHKFDERLKSLLLGADPQNQNWTNFDVKPIASNAGDLIVWRHSLPHGSSPNSAQSPRIVQYFNMKPVVQP